jgi:hypothetical protein
VLETALLLEEKEPGILPPEESNGPVLIPEERNAAVIFMLVGGC